MKRLGLLPKLIIAIILGILIGSVAPKWVVQILATFNSIFGSFLGFAIPLIIIGFVVPGIGELGHSAGKLLAVTAGLAYASTIFAGTAAFFTAQSLFPMILTVGGLSSDAANTQKTTIEPFFKIDMPPIMGVMTALLIAFVIGMGIAVIKGDTIKKFMNEFGEIIEKLISRIIIPLLPYHILGIFANMTFTGQVATIISVFAKVFVVIILLDVVILLIQFAVAGTVAGGNPIRLLINMLPAYFTAVGTQSSAATIPVTLERTKKNGVHDGVADFVIPLCATIHLSGSTVSLVSLSMAVMLLNGQTTTFASYLPFIMMLGVTMVAAPGVPGGAVMAALGVLENMLGFSPEMLSLIIALHVAQDSFGTATNITGDCAIAIIVNRVSGHRLTREH